jgi:hypothetical protein
LRLLYAVVDLALRKAKGNEGVCVWMRGLLFGQLRYGAPVRGTERLAHATEALPHLKQALEALDENLRGWTAGRVEAWGPGDIPEGAATEDRTGSMVAETSIFPAPAAVAWVLAKLLAFEETRTEPLASFRPEACVQR